MKECVEACHKTLQAFYTPVAASCSRGPHIRKTEERYYEFGGRQLCLLISKPFLRLWDIDAFMKRYLYN